MATPIPTAPKTPLSVKPLADAAVKATKRAFTPKPHLTHRPFEELKSLLNAR